jgi:hypothetical protein
VDSWEMTPQPLWYDEGTFGGPWSQLTGVFLNTTNGSPDHIANLDGDQAMYLFALPEVGVFQDYDSIGGTNSSPSNEFDATYQVGRSYELTIGVVPSFTQPPTNGATLLLSFYYRDGSSNRVSLASAVITNNASTFVTLTNLVDVSVALGPVLPGQAWSGAHVGVEIRSTVGFDAIGGIWDVDNVRVTESVAPSLSAPSWDNGQFEFVLLSNPGAAFEILTTADASQALSNWTSLTMVTNVTGSINVQDSETGGGRRFYVARQLP